MELTLSLTFLVAFISSILSGIAGVGGGFIMAPYWLLIGMTPAQGATNGSFMALGMSASSLVAFRGTEHFPRNKKLTAVLVAITVITSTAGALILPHIEVGSFKVILAAVTIISLPLLFINKKKIHYHRRHQIIGLMFLTLLLLAGSIIFSSAFSILIAIVLSTLLNLTVLQSTALRRLIGLVQVSILFGVLALQGNFIWTHALVAISGGALGSYIGTRIAIKKGEKFAKYALAVGALISAVALLF